MMDRQRPARVLVVAVAHFPPPVHGLAVAAENFVRLLSVAAGEAGGQVVQVQLAASMARRSPRHLVQRSVRGLLAALTLVRYHRQAPAVYLTSDSSLGLAITALVASFARVMRLKVFIHHHSYAYIGVRRRAFAAALIVIGRRAVHLVGCSEMARDLSSQYRSVRHVRLVPIMYAVEPGSAVSGSRDPTPAGRDRPLVLGHLSNLCAEKGLNDVFETLRATRDSGLQVRLVVAGPAANPGAEELLGRLMAEESDAYQLGPVYGKDRDDFFDGIDLFLFPSRYRHESFGLVVGEALSRGVPVAVYRAGCLTEQVVGSNGLVLSPEQPFAHEVAAWVTREGVTPAIPSRDPVDSAREVALGVAREVVAVGSAA